MSDSEAKKLADVFSHTEDGQSGNLSKSPESSVVSLQSSSSEDQKVENPPKSPESPLISLQSGSSEDQKVENPSNSPESTSVSLQSGSSEEDQEVENPSKSAESSLVTLQSGSSEEDQTVENSSKSPESPLVPLQSGSSEEDQEVENPSKSPESPLVSLESGSSEEDETVENPSKSPESPLVSFQSGSSEEDQKVENPDQQNSEEEIKVFAEEKLKVYEEMMIKKRKYANRPDSLLEMTRLQLVCERVALTSALLDYELKLVRPSSDYERTVMRSLYDRLEKILQILNVAPSFRKATTTLKEAMKTNPDLEKVVNKASDVQVPKPLVVGGYEDPSKKVKGKKKRQGVDDVVAKCESHPVVRKWLDSLSSPPREVEDWKKYEKLSEMELEKSLLKALQKIRECGRTLRRLEGDCTWTGDRRAADKAYDDLEAAQRKARLFENLLKKKRRGK